MECDICRIVIGYDNCKIVINMIWCDICQILLKYHICQIVKRNNIGPIVIEYCIYQILIKYNMCLIVINYYICQIVIKFHICQIVRLWVGLSNNWYLFIFSQLVMTNLHYRLARWLVRIFIFFHTWGVNLVRTRGAKEQEKIINKGILIISHNNLDWSF